jgi:S-adenosylmethionine synthetase
LPLNAPPPCGAAAYGHFGRTPDAEGGFSWEKTNLVEALKAAV